MQVVVLSRSDSGGPGDSAWGLAMKWLAERVAEPSIIATSLQLVELVLCFVLDQVTSYSSSVVKWLVSTFPAIGHLTIFEASTSCAQRAEGSLEALSP